MITDRIRDPNKVCCIRSFVENMELAGTDNENLHSSDRPVASGGSSRAASRLASGGMHTNPEHSHTGRGARASTPPFLTRAAHRITAGTLKLTKLERLGIVASAIWVIGAGAYQYNSAANADLKFANTIAEACMESHNGDDSNNVCMNRSGDFYDGARNGEILEAVIVGLVPLPFAWGVVYFARSLGFTRNVGAWNGAEKRKADEIWSALHQASLRISRAVASVWRSARLGRR
jgi:hypothetical protein